MLQLIYTDAAYERVVDLGNFMLSLNFAVHTNIAIDTKYFQMHVLWAAFQLYSFSMTT